MSINLSNWHLAAALALPTIAVMITNKLLTDSSKDKLEKEEEEDHAQEQQTREHVEETAQKTVENVQVPQRDFPLSKQICFIGFGVLTSIEANFCVFDFKIKFDRSLIENFLNKNLYIGTVFKYLGYKPKGSQDLQVIQVISIETESWEPNMHEKELKELILKTDLTPIEKLRYEIKNIKCEVVDKLPTAQIVLSHQDDRYKVNFVPSTDMQTSPNIGDDVELKAVFPEENSQFPTALLEVIYMRVLKKVVVKEPRWVEIRCKPLPPFSNGTTTQILQVFVINQRSGALTLINIELLTQETGKKHAFIKLLKPELYTNCFNLKGHTEHLMELEVQREAENSETLHLELTFDRFKLKRFINVVSQNEKTSLVPARFRRPNLSEIYKKRFTIARMPDYEVPDKLFEAFMTKKTYGELNEYLHIEYMFLNTELNMKSYKQRFDLLLHLEELETYKALRNYDCTAAHFIKEGEFLGLLIEDLLERRPSLCIGDTVRLKRVENGKDTTIDGTIQKVLLDRVHIKFTEQFHASYSNEAYDLEFHYSRVTVRKMHHGISLMARRQSSFLFPEKLVSHEKLQLQASLENGDLLIDQNKHTWFNKALNISQKRAVCNVLRGEMDMPYCIFGPPGTGKTVTVVETILQLQKHVPKSCMLVAAPSNSAANMIALRLLMCKPQIQMIRLVSYSHMESDLIPQEILKHCAVFEYGTISEQMTQNTNGVKFCSLELLRQSHLVISTCMTLGNLMQTQFCVDHFTHAIIDEAAQCHEPELMCVAALLGAKGQLILSGDHQQLPPTILNRIAIKKGLGVSFMERVLDMEPYAKNKQVFPETNGYDSRLVTMLIYNYRSLPSILNLYNYLFYDQELISVLKYDSPVELKFLKAGKLAIKEMGEKFQVNALPDYHGAYFCALKSVNMKATDSPSWYNEIEAKHVYCTALALMAHGVAAGDIGIISPYIKQVRFLRGLFQNEADSEIPKIGTIEEFQGQERAIILISTVRTKEAHIKEDRRQFLGFLKQPCRLNVAISRARALVVVFGNPALLCKDEHWLTYIQYCYTNNTCYGDASSLTMLDEMMAESNESEQSEE